MVDFKENAGAKKNDRDELAKNSLAKEQPKPAESELDKWNYNAPSDALGCRKVESLQDQLSALKVSKENPKASFFKKQDEYYQNLFNNCQGKQTLPVRSYIVTED